MNGHSNVILAANLGLNIGCYSFTPFVFFGYTVVVIFGKRTLAVRVKLIDTDSFINLIYIIIRIRQRNNRSVLHEYGKFPERSCKIVEYAVPVVFFARKIINPYTFGQVNAVTDIISLLVSFGCLIDRSNQKIRPVQILVLCSRALSIGIRVFQKHRSYHRHTVYGFLSDTVSIRHQFRFQFQIPAVNGGCRFSQGVRVFLIRSPTVHVQFHWSKRFPLEITGIHLHIPATENTVHIRSDIRLTGQSRADIGRDVETDIFPYASRLVTRPDARIALCARPAVKGDDKRSGVTSVVRHYMSDVGYSVQSERIAGTDPGYIRFQHAYSGIPYFFHNISLQQSAHSFLRVQVRLCPQADFHSVLTGIITQTFQILYITVQCFRLSVAGSIAVVRKQPAQRHVMVLITVDYRTCRELIIVLLAVQRFFDSAIVLLALFISLSVFKQNAFLVFCPIVTVISVQMSLIETEFR